MRSLLKTLLVSTSLCVGIVAEAVPAKPGLIPFTQPDGSVINVRIHGDEFFNYYTTEDGYYLIQEADQFYYADIDAIPTGTQFVKDNIFHNVVFLLLPESKNGIT